VQQHLAKQKQQEHPAPNRGIAIVMEKDDSKPKKRSLMKIRIKKIEEKPDEEDEGEEKSKVRVIE
jgi:hypothetical protein